MDIQSKVFTLLDFPYLDDDAVGKPYGIMYGKNASIKLSSINKNESPDNKNIRAIYKLPELTTSVGTVYVVVDDICKKAKDVSFNVERGLLTISNGRSSTGSTYDVKLVDCVGYTKNGNSYPKTVLEHFFTNYGKIEYNDSNFDISTWSTELNHSSINADIGFLLKGDESFWDVVFNISRKSKSFFRVDYRPDGRIYAKRIDTTRASSAIISSSELHNAGSLKISSSREGVYSSVLTKYYHNDFNDTWLSVKNTTYEKEVRKTYRKIEELVDETYLINNVDATYRAYNNATKFADMISTVELEIFHHYEIDLYDVITVSLMPDNLSSNSRQFSGNKDCLVVKVNPNETNQINYVTVQIIPDRIPIESQSAVMADAFTTIEREKSVTESIVDSVDTLTNTDGYLTKPNIILYTDEFGNVLSYTEATGSFHVISINDVTAESTFAIDFIPVGVTGSIDSSGVYAITGVTNDTSVLAFSATYKGIKITKTVTLLKQREGIAGYVYVRYSAYADGTDFGLTSDTYIGVCVTSSSTAPEDKTSYTWTRIRGQDAYVTITNPLETENIYTTGTYGYYSSHIYVWTLTGVGVGYWTLVPPERAIGISQGMYYSFDEPINDTNGSILIVDNSGKLRNGAARSANVITGIRGNALSLQSASSYIGIY